MESHNGVELATEIEDNEHDHYAVAVMLGGVILGQLPQEISHVCYHFIKHGEITCRITGRKLGKGLGSTVCLQFFRIQQKIKEIEDIVIVFHCRYNYCYNYIDKST